jgi:hypothetical protein
MTIVAFINGASGYASEDSVEEPSYDAVYSPGGGSNVIRADIVAPIMRHSSEHISSQGVQSHNSELCLRFTAIQATSRWMNCQQLQ